MSDNREHALEFGFALLPNKRAAEIEMATDDATICVELDKARLTRLTAVMSAACGEMSGEASHD